jgi:two-component system, sensor histidine kinase and response regulator
MSDPDGRHILLVEDTITQSLIMQHLLESHQFKVSTARDANKALEFLLSQRPDLILSDVSMPEMDGYELCQRVKSSPDTNSIPFVLLSSFHDASEILNVVNCGADYFMLKRFDEKYIVGGLEDALRSCRAEASAKVSQSAPALEPITITGNGADHLITGNQLQLANMLFSAFRTVTHLLPFVQED